MTYVGLIAGHGKMPIKIIEELHARGQKILLLAIDKYTPKNLVDLVDKVVWGKISKIGYACSICKKFNVKEVVMAGLIRHNNVFSLSMLNMDFVTAKAFLTLKDLRADTICLKVIEIFKNKGITFLPTHEILKHYLAKEGILTSKKPSRKILDDVLFGIQLAKELGRLDIGQTVVVKNKSVVALEAMEGTDLCLQRAGDVAGTGCVVVKLSKPKQDMRFDVPVIGKNTIEKLIKIKASAIAIEAEKTLILDHDLIGLANHHNIIILSINLSHQADNSLVLN